MASHTEHYNDVAKDYANAEFYRDGTYRDWQLRLVGKALGSNVASVADVGGGDGTFTRDCVLSEVFVEVIEPSEAMVKMVPSSLSSKNTVFVHSDAAAWAAATGGRTFDAILLKEVVHHIIDRSVFWGDVLARRVAANGVVVVVTRPKVEIDYPFWDAARVVWSENQPAEAEIASELTAAGFSNVSTTVETFPMSFPLERWLALIRSRFWSTFSAFSDAELDDAIDIVRQREQRADGLVEFEERIVVVVGRNTT